MSVCARWRVVAAAALLACAAYVVIRGHYSTDLSAFLPRHATRQQALLVDQLRDGPLSRVLLIAIDGGEAQARARASQSLAQTLRASPAFTRIDNGTLVDAAADQRFLFEHRYVLSPAVNTARFEVAGLSAAMADSIDVATSPAGALLKPLLPADPTGEVLAIAGRLQRQPQPRRDHGVWVSPSGERALLLAQTTAVGSDTDAQASAIAQVRRVFDAQADSGLHLTVSGPGVFAAAARDGIEHTAKRLALFSALAIFALLYATYRSFTALALGLAPVLCGALAGIAAVVLGFGTVHGVTLGFGATLIGEAVDYSIYLFVQSRSGGVDPDGWRRQQWPTIRLGLFTSVIGFASLLPSGFPGLAQLGLYSVAGLLCAGLFTRFVLPDLLPRHFAVRDLTPLGTWVGAHLPPQRTGGRVAAAMFAAALITLAAHRGSFWNSELVALSPVPLSAQRIDAQLRAELGAAEAGALVAISAATQEAALQSAEQAAQVLDALQESATIAGYDSPALFLPSLAAQQARRAALPAPAELRERASAALEGLPLRADRIEPFFRDVEAARQAAPLTRASLDGTSFASAVDSLTSRSKGEFRVLLPLHAPALQALDSRAVRSAFEQHPVSGLAVLDLKQASDDLYGEYLHEALRLSALGLVGICLLLAVTLRSVRRLLQVLAPLLIAVTTITALLVLAGKQLTILHLVGMLLVVAIGSNYALFFVRMDSPATLASLLIANMTTVIAFGTLALADVPVLAALGETVAPGALLALVCSALLWGGRERRS